jgi:hypothetical protein
MPCAPATATAQPSPLVAPVRTGTSLRWSFRRREAIVTCQLGLDSEESAYELTTTVPWSVDPTVERFADAIAALQRQAAVERLLVDEGWSLERFAREEIG